MIHDPRPSGNWDVDVVNWRAAYDRQHTNYYEMEQGMDPYSRMVEKEAV